MVEYSGTLEYSSTLDLSERGVWPVPLLLKGSVETSGLGSGFTGILLTTFPRMHQRSAVSLLLSTPELSFLAELAAFGTFLVAEMSSKRLFRWLASSLRGILPPSSCVWLKIERKAEL